MRLSTLAAAAVMTIAVAGCTGTFPAPTQGASVQSGSSDNALLSAYEAGMRNSEQSGSIPGS
jgi:hypothetical protein